MWFTLKCQRTFLMTHYILIIFYFLIKSISTIKLFITFCMIPIPLFYFCYLQSFWHFSEVRRLEQLKQETFSQSFYAAQTLLWIQQKKPFFAAWHPQVDPTYSRNCQEYKLQIFVPGQDFLWLKDTVKHMVESLQLCN